MQQQQQQWCSPHLEQQNVAGDSVHDTDQVHGQSDSGLANGQQVAILEQSGEKNTPAVTFCDQARHGCRVQNECTPL